jgi:hypothetical protein
VTQGPNNLNHVLDSMQRPCTDPDCELHHPEVIEEESERLTATAWFIAGILHGHSYDTITRAAEDLARNVADEARAQ